MRIKNWITSIIAIGLTLVIVANLAGPTAWAASAIAPVGQTVPTRTPTPEPATATMTPTEPPATEQPVATTPAPAQSPTLLPEAGSGPDGGLVLFCAVGLALIALSIATRQRTRRRSG